MLHYKDWRLTWIDWKTWLLSRTVIFGVLFRRVTWSQILRLWCRDGLVSNMKAPCYCGRFWRQMLGWFTVGQGEGYKTDYQWELEREERLLREVRKMVFALPWRELVRWWWWKWRGDAIRKGAVPVKGRAVKLGYPSITYSRSYFQHFLPSCLMQTWLFSIHVSCWNTAEYSPLAPNYEPMSMWEPVSSLL